MHTNILNFVEDLALIGGAWLASSWDFCKINHVAGLEMLVNKNDRVKLRYNSFMIYSVNKITSWTAR